MRLTTIVAAVTLAFAVPAPGESMGDRLDYEKAKLLCKWKETHAPPGNPVPTPFCSNPNEPILEVKGQVREWWAYWYQHDMDAGARLELEFNKVWDEAPRQYLEENPAPVASLTVKELCAKYALYKGAPDARAELQRRKVFTAAQWALIDEKTFRIGSPENVVLCAWGEPKEVNMQAIGNSVQRQYVYGMGAYVYIENGRVTAFQGNN